MFANLIMGTLLMVINLGIQVMAVSFLLNYFSNRVLTGDMGLSFATEAKSLSVTMSILMLGHFFMFATWALLFTSLGEFEDFATAFYHSTVNFTSLGYGDIVMSDERRLLGALEAANGVLMFGLTAGAILSVMNGMFSRRKAAHAIKERLKPGK